jgi:Kef-type K+ transport system membrane component KefB
MSHTHTRARAQILTFMCIFLSSFFTEAVGVHAIFGAFLLGLATPQYHPATLR